MKKAALFCVALAATLGSASFSVGFAEENDDVLVADFNDPDYGNWSIEGTAFCDWPARGTFPGQRTVSGYEGERLVNSFNGGDGATGKLTSPEVDVVKPFINFLIGGGGHAGTRIELVVDGAVVRTKRGPNVQPGGSEALDWATWDVSEFVGKKAVFQIIDEERGGWGHINVDQIVFSDRKRAEIDPVDGGVPQFVAKEYFVEIPVEKRFLLIPIQEGAPTRWVRVEVDGKIEREFIAEVAGADVKPSFWATLDARNWIGKTLKIVVEKADEDAKFTPIRQSEKVAGGETTYDEKYRPQFHFSPRSGWMNDPNGLVYYNGRYHLFYQHNPYGRMWFNNKTWGHATSVDLIHWEDGPSAIEPDRLGAIYSGSSAVDWKNSSGFQTDSNGPPPLVCMFTYCGQRARGNRPMTQALAYSLDGGETFVKYEGNPTIPHIVGRNRDPKIFWSEKSNRWICALYMENGDYALFTSDNLKSWTKTCDIQDLGCKECPDIFPLPVDGDATRVRWVFWGGDGKYLIGDFDGERFIKEAGPFDAKRGGNDYAAQSFSDVPNRRIQLSWMEGGDHPEMPFNQQFTVPRELTLQTTPDGVRLCINPIEELKTLRGAALNLTAKTTDGGALELVPSDGTASAAFDLLDAELTLTVGDGATGRREIAIRGRKIVLDLDAKTITHSNVVAPLTVVDGKIDLRLTLDRTSLEIFANQGLSQIAKCFVPADENDAPILKLSGELADDVENGNVQVWPMKSVWNVETR